MIRILCSMLLLGGTIFTPAFAQNHELLASTKINPVIHETATENETSTVVTEKKENLVLLPGLNEKAVMLVEPGLKIQSSSDPFAVKPRSFIMPAGLMALGTYCLFNEEFKDVNNFAKESMWNNKDNHGFVPDHVTMFLPFVAYYGLNAAGIKGQHKIIDATLIYTMSSVITNSIVFTVKNRSAVERPDASDLLSFPSGHTAQAFVSAEFLRQEYKHISPWYGIAGYAAAVGTGMLRMRHNKHWLNDVVAGAGVGILSTRVSYWLYPKIKKLVMPGAKDDIMIAPSYSNGAVGLSFMYSFK